MYKTLMIISIMLGLLACSNVKEKTAKIHTPQKTGTTIGKEKIYKKEFLWKENIFHQKLGDTISQTTINKPYASNIPEDEKAAIAYVLTFVNNGCDWENGDASPERNNLVCKGLATLDLGYQCSEKHISFLNDWFKNDSISLQKIKRCPPFFPGTTITTSLKSLTLEKNKDKITIFASIIGSNTRHQRTSEWMKVYTFSVQQNSILLADDSIHKKERIKP